MSAFRGKDLDFVMVSHGHEDHDGSLFEIAESTGAKVKGHEIYDRLIRFYPERAPNDVRKRFPASCWRCFMPESFSTNCLEYQQTRSRLKIETIEKDCSNLSKSALAYHVPGHSPDSLAIFVGGEAVLVGDTVLPNITPWPTQESFFDQVGEILKPPILLCRVCLRTEGLYQVSCKAQRDRKEFERPHCTSWPSPVL